jgi:hypothetical protein
LQNIVVGLAEKLRQDLATVPAGPAASTADPADHMYNNTNDLSLQKLAVKAELGNQAYAPTHSHLLLMYYFGLYFGRNPGSRPWTSKIYSKEGNPCL